MSYQVGGAHVPVSPDFRGFHKKIAAEFKAASAEAGKWGADAGKRFAGGFQDELRVKFARLPHARIKAEADTKDADAKLDRAARDRTSRIKTVVDKVPGGRLAALALTGAAAYGPPAAGLAAGLAGVAADFGAAGVAGAAFGAIAVPMFKKVTAAQQAFTKARQAYDLATTKAGRAAALRKEQLALQGLTPAERDLAKRLNDLKGAWAGLGKTMQPVVATSLGPWFSVARTGLSYLPSLIVPAAGAIHELGQDAERAFDKPFWGKFFSTVGTTGSLAITGFGRAVGHLADGLGHLFVTFAPDLQKLPGDIDRWSAAFDRWAKHYRRSGFDGFMRKTFSPANVNNLKSSLKATGALLGKVATATENISPAAMAGLNNVLVTLSKLTPGQIEALGVLYVAGKLNGGVVGGLAGRVLGKGGGKAAEGAAGLGAGRAFLGAGGEVAIGAIGSREAGFGAGNLLGRPAFNKNLGNQSAKATGFGSKLAPPFSWISAFTNWAAGPPVAAVTTGWQKLDKAAKPAIKSLYTSSASEIKTAGKTIAHGLGSGWDASSGWVSKQVGRAKGWVTSGVSGAAGWLVSHGRSAAHGLGSGISSAAGWVSRQAGKIKGWVTSHVSGAASWLVSAGKAVMSGFLSGLHSAWSAVANWVSSRASWIAAHKGPLAADRVLLIPHGKAIMASLLAGLKRGFPSVSKFITSATRLITGATHAGLISGTTDSALTKWLASDNKRLTKLAAQRSKIAAQIAAAQSYAKSVKGNLKSGFDLGNLPGLGTGAPMSISDITGFVSGQASQIKTFARNITRLKKAGVADALIRQITALGPAQGNQVATAILAGGKSDIKALNQAEARATRWAKKAGLNAADALYDQGKNAGKGILAGLKSQEAAITKEMTRIARQIVRTLRRELKIGSPSKLTHQIGVWTGAGIPAGLRTQEGPTRLAATRLARAAIPMPWQAGNGMVRGGDGARQLTGNLYLDSGELLGVVRGEIRDHDREVVRAAKAGTGRR